MAESSRTRQVKGYLEDKFQDELARKFAPRLLADIFRRNQNNIGRVTIEVKRDLENLVDSFFRRVSHTYMDLGMHCEATLVGPIALGAKIKAPLVCELSDHSLGYDVEFVKRMQEKGHQTQTRGGVTHRLQPGDCLWDLSLRYYGAAVLWKEIHQANLKEIGQNPDIIIAGTAVEIPALELLDNQTYPRNDGSRPGGTNLAVRKSLPVCFPTVAASIQSPIRYDFSIPASWADIRCEISLEGTFIYQQKGCIQNPTKINLDPSRQKINVEYSKLLAGLTLTISSNPISVKISHKLYESKNLTIDGSYTLPSTIAGEFALKQNILDVGDGILYFEGKGVLKLTLGAKFDIRSKAAAVQKAVQLVNDVIVAEGKIFKVLAEGKLKFNLVKIGQLNPAMAEHIKNWAVSAGFVLFDQLSEEHPMVKNTEI